MFYNKATTAEKWIIGNTKLPGKIILSTWYMVIKKVTSKFNDKSQNLENKLYENG